MILVGNQRGGARNLALHLTNDENDHVEVHELRGFVADDLMGALKEVDAVSKGTRCRQYLFSLSINPPAEETVSTESFEAAIEKVENKLGLKDQPRAIVFHEKEGDGGYRRHAHVVWSRINTDEMKAIQLSHSKRKLNAVSKELYLEHGWRLPAGYIDRSMKDPLTYTLDEWQQARRNGLDPKKIKETFQDAWASTGSAETFANALRERGFEIAKGDRRGYVAIDRFCEVYSIPHQCNVKTKEVKARLGPADKLPSLDQAKDAVARQMEQKLSSFIHEIDANITARKEEIARQRIEMRDRHREEKVELQRQHKRRQQQESISRQSRFRKGLPGLWDFIRGEHHRIARANKDEAMEAKLRDLKEGNALSAKHLDERRDLTNRVRELPRELEKAHSKRISIQEEIESLRSICQMSIRKSNRKRLGN